MEGRQLILNDGTTIDGGEAGYADGFLWMWFGGMTLQEAAALVFDPVKTEKIIFQYGEMQDTYDGFTSCRSISINTDGRISVCMTREVGA